MKYEELSPKWQKVAIQKAREYIIDGLQEAAYETAKPYVEETEEVMKVMIDEQLENNEYEILKDEVTGEPYLSLVFD